jgi:hypothetical protein
MPAQGLCGPLALALIFGFLSLAPAGARTAGDSSRVDDHWNLFTPEQEARLGLELGAWVEASTSPLENARSQDALFVVGRRLLADAPAAVAEPDFRLLRTAQPYALGLPGGRLYLGSALIAWLADETELAGALAHELAHIALRQITRKLSRAKRFRIHAALVSAEHGKATLLEALQAIELDVVPGAPLMRYTADEEAEASIFAARLLLSAGYPAQAASQFHERLRGTAGEAAMRYLERHPGFGATPPDEARAADGKPAARSLSKRAFRRLVRDAARRSADAAPVDALLAWTAPVIEPQPARSRERFINRSYVFDYPADWLPGKPGFNETIEVAPRGGRLQAAGQPSRLVVGLLAGTLDPVAGDLAGSDTLAQHLAALRPGLQSAEPPDGQDPAITGLAQRFLNGASPAGGAERVWALSRRLPESVFYMLLVAPAGEFASYQTEFEAIAASIDFQGHPRTGRADVQRRDGAPK